MGIKFDGTKVKDGGKTIGNIYRDALREGSSSGGRKLISLKDAARKIGTSSQGHSTALVWWFFGR